MSGHPRDLAGLVDGELGHAARERALAHLAHCTVCRAEVEAQRRLKARLRSTSSSEPAPALLARLLELPGSEQSSYCDPGPGPATRRPGALRGPHARRGPRTSGGPRRPATRRRTRATVGGALLTLGTLAVLALGGAPTASSRTPLDPTGDDLLVEHARSAAELPLPDPGGVTTAGFAR